MIKQEVLSISTTRRCQWVDLTGGVSSVIDKSGIKRGTCLVASLHTTGGVTINENADPDVERDFFHALEKLVPQSTGFRHAEGNSDSHVKSSLVGLHVQIPISDGKLVLGTWQSVYFCEFDGPRSRRLAVTVSGE